ncbi:MAG: hypothetical protein AB1600_04265 [Bacteroidota bacterium]
MFKGSLGILFSIVIFLLIEGCSVSHETMRGSVVAMVENEAHICIGKIDGLKISDMLAVYRTRRVGQSNLPHVSSPPYHSPGEIARSYQYEKVRVGKVKVTRIFDEHFAAVEIVEGEVDFPDIVEKTLVP